MFAIGMILAIAGVLIVSFEELFFLAIAIGFIGVCMMIVGYEATQNNEMEDCKSIGGEYIVVDEQWTGKVMMDIYGCVKK